MGLFQCIQLLISSGRPLMCPVDRTPLSPGNLFPNRLASDSIDVLLSYVTLSSEPLHPSI